VTETENTQKFKIDVAKSVSGSWIAKNATVLSEIEVNQKFVYPPTATVACCYNYTPSQK
jgi:hypothetical protein